MKCKVKINLKTGEKIGYTITPIDTVIVDGAFIKIYQMREDGTSVLSKYAMNEIKKIKIKEVKYI